LKNKHWAAALILLVIVCLSLTFFLRSPGTPATHAEIRSGGNTITIDLSEDQEFTMECEDGYNIITVRDGKIAVTEADCPDQYCVRQGFCNSGVGIVCLPHGLVIRFLGDSGIDGVIG